MQVLEVMQLYFFREVGWKGRTDGQTEGRTEEGREVSVSSISTAPLPAVLNSCQCVVFSIHLLPIPSSIF